MPFPFRFIRCLAAAAAIAALLAPAHAQQKVRLKMIGQPIATGLIQKKEQQFFENFAARAGMPVEIDYKPIDTLGIKDTEQLRVMKSGLFDVVSLRMSQNSRDEPTLLGLDLVGASPDYASGHKVAKAYFDTVDQRLQKQFGVKLLGVWPFGPQILFCKKPIAKLADIKGMKVRVADQNLAKFIELVGGTPVPVSFPDTHQSLSLGVLDCAITGPSSANSAGWPEVTTHQMPLAFQMAQMGYGISLKSWNRLPADQQAKLKLAFEGFTDEIWKYSEELFKDALNCNAGKDPCTTGKKFTMAEVPVSPADLELVRSAVLKVSLPAWAEICNKSNPDCAEKWQATVAPALGLK